MENVCHTITILVLSSLLAIGCTENVSKENFDSIQIESEVESVFEAYVNHVNLNGLEAVDTFFLDDDRFYWVEDGLIQYPTKASLVIGLKEFIPQVDSVKMEILDTETDAISERHASFFVRFKEDIILKSGYKFTLDGAITILMEKKDGSWKFLNGHSSTKKPRGG
ncbi:MAG: hypothetical protein AB7O48_16175 [Cyclobacteriaceae bacterium]